MKTARTAKALHLLCELSSTLGELTDTEWESLLGQPLFESIAADIMRHLSSAFNEPSNVPSRVEQVGSYEELRLEAIMNRLRTYVLDHPHDSYGASQVRWLVRILLLEPRVIPTVREIDTFLANITGFNHSTKSTGRDRIVDWYLNEVEKLPRPEQDYIYGRILRNLFVTVSSDYRQWKTILEKLKG